MVSAAVEADPIFYPVFCLFVPTCIIAALFNASLVFVLVRSRDKLLAVKLDQIVAALICVCLFRSSVSSVRYLLLLFRDPTPSGNKLIGVHGSLGVCLMLSLHLILAVERHMVLCQVEPRRSRMYYVTSLAVCFLLSFAILVAVVNSESSNRVTLDPIFHPLRNSAWLWLMIVTCTVIITGILLVYRKTYTKMTAQLRENLASHREERLRLFLEQKVLKSCIIMSLTMICCYLPAAISLIVSNWLTMDSTVLVWIRSISGELILLDLIVSPVMIVFFQTNLRAEVSKLYRWGKARHPILDVSELKPMALNTSPPMLNNGTSNSTSISPATPNATISYETPLGNAFTTYLILPTFLAGLLVNGFLVFTFIYSRRKLLTTRLDRIVLTLLIVCIIWSGSNSRKYLRRIIWPDLPATQLGSFMNSVNLILVFGINLLLAVERFFVFRNTDHLSSRPYFAIVIGTMLVQTVISGWLFLTSPSSNGVTPDEPFQRSVWIMTMTVSFIAQNFAIAILYWRTYICATQDLLKSGDDEMNKARLLVRHKVLMYCILMASTLIILYLPTVLSYLLWVLAPALLKNKAAVVLVDRIVIEILALDVLATPGLVIYFNAEARMELMCILRLRRRDSGRMPDA
ncbi:hypothetical protein HDU81_009041 [Chytriomyces hyalinus]|nr:hypothetical protein HDU81_009041 [Chytriomyces hyalinus]